LNALRAKSSEELGDRDGAGFLFCLDEKALTRDCIAKQLAMLLPEFTVVPVATSHEFEAFATTGREPCCILYNVHWHHVEEEAVVNTLSLLQKTAPEARTGLISDLESTDDIVAALRHGAKAYVPTSLSLEIVSEIIRLIHAGGTFVPASALAATGLVNPVTTILPALPTPAVDLDHFTVRQLEVLNCLWEGKQNKTIAYELKISESTVKVHIRQIMKKVRARNRTQIVLLTQQIHSIA
jgi:DNA-binding NarL/FixJ family response regulator